MISIITSDGRNLVVRRGARRGRAAGGRGQRERACAGGAQGTLRGFDQTINVVLDGATERVYSLQSGVEEIPLGLQVVRGDNVAVIGEVDEEMDNELDLSQLKAAPLRHVAH